MVETVGAEPVEDLLLVGVGMDIELEHRSVVAPGGLLFLEGEPKPIAL